MSESTIEYPQAQFFPPAVLILEKEAQKWSAVAKFARETAKIFHPEMLYPHVDDPVWRAATTNIALIVTICADKYGCYIGLHGPLEEDVNVRLSEYWADLYVDDLRQAESDFTEEEEDNYPFHS